MEAENSVARRRALNGGWLAHYTEFNQHSSHDSRKGSPPLGRLPRKRRVFLFLRGTATVIDGESAGVCGNK